MRMAVVGKILIVPNKKLFVDLGISPSWRENGQQHRYIPVALIAADECTMFNLPRLGRETEVYSWRCRWAFVAVRRSLDGPSKINEPREGKVKLKQNY